jgi:hypothetical protein
MLALLAVGACNAEVRDAGGSTPNEAQDGGQDSGQDGSTGGTELARRAGERILVDGTRSVILTDDGGGYAPTPPSGSTCHGQAEYRYVLDSRELTWSACPFSDDPEPWHEVSGARTLDRADHDRVIAALREIVVSSERRCGVDKQTLTITIKTEDAEQLYTDSFYSCRGDKEPYVDGIDEVFAEARRLSSDPPLQCQAVPTCAAGRTQFASRSDCDDDGWDCEEVTLCGMTIWCGMTFADCDYAQQVYEEFLAANDACSVDADCAVIGDCGPNADFAAIRADAAIEGRELQNARCGGAYDGPTYDAYCNAGTCALREQPPSTEYGCPPLWDEDAGVE